MPELSPRRHTVPAAGEHPSRKGWVLDPLLSVNDIVPVANATDQDLLVDDLTAAGLAPTASRPLHVDRIDTGRLERTTDGDVWTVIGGRNLGDQSLSAQVLATADWGDIVSITATTTGQRCVAHWDAIAFNGASGADRTIRYRVLLDGAVLGPAELGPFEVPLRSGNVRSHAGFTHRSIPAAGSHTWKLQAKASAATAVYVEQAVLTVDERP